MLNSFLITEFFVLPTTSTTIYSVLPHDLKYLLLLSRFSSKNLWSFCSGISRNSWFSRGLLLRKWQVYRLLLTVSPFFGLKRKSWKLSSDQEFKIASKYIMVHRLSYMRHFQKNQPLTNQTKPKTLHSKKHQEGRPHKNK